MANDSSAAFKAMIQELRASTHVVLMLVPYRTSFRARIDQVDLPEVSCIYEVTSGNMAFGEALDAIGTRVALIDEPKPVPDVRVGIVFKRNDNVLQEFYFNDFGGRREVNGFKGERRIKGSPDLPSHFRSIAVKPGVSLVHDRHSRCPHA